MFQKTYSILQQKLGGHAKVSHVALDITVSADEFSLSPGRIDESVRPSRQQDESLSYKSWFMGVRSTQRCSFMQLRSVKG